jgi:hypothetical protein
LYSAGWGQLDCNTGAESVPAKKVEIRFAVVLLTKSINLVCDYRHRQSVGIVQCHRESQYRQMPGT